MINMNLYDYQDDYGKLYIIGIELLNSGIYPVGIVEQFQLTMSFYPESKERLQEYINTFDALKINNPALFDDLNGLDETINQE